MVFTEQQAFNMSFWVLPGRTASLGVNELWAGGFCTEEKSQKLLQMMIGRPLKEAEPYN